MPQSSERRGDTRSVLAYLDLGLRFALTILVAAGGGYVLDRWLHTLPLFLVVGLVLGAVAGFLNIYRTVFPSSRGDTSRK